MGKKMRPKMDEQAGFNGAPPSYDESIIQRPYPTAPVAPVDSSIYQPPPLIQRQPQLQPQQQQQQPIILVQTLHALGPRPCLLVCPSCQQQQKTKVSTESSMKTHLMAAVLCLLGCCCCACLPYCMDSCQNTNHYCSNCNAYIGMYNK